MKKQLVRDEGKRIERELAKAQQKWEENVKTKRETVSEGQCC